MILKLLLFQSKHVVDLHWHDGSNPLKQNTSRFNSYYKYLDKQDEKSSKKYYDKDHQRLKEYYKANRIARFKQLRKFWDNKIIQLVKMHRASERIRFGRHS